VAVILLETMAPNGKLLGECSGQECAGFGSWYTAIARRVAPTAIVGKVLSEAEVRNIYDDATAVVPAAVGLGLARLKFLEGAGCALRRRCIAKTCEERSADLASDRVRLHRRSRCVADRQGSNSSG
jgi:hypothetical protein